MAAKDEEPAKAGKVIFIVVFKNRRDDKHFFSYAVDTRPSVPEGEDLEIEVEKHVGEFKDIAEARKAALDEVREKAYELGIHIGGLTNRK